MCMSTLKHLGLEDLPHKLQVNSVMPFSELLQGILLVLGSGIHVLHRAPWATGRAQEHFIRNFILKSL